MILIFDLDLLRKIERWSRWLYFGKTKNLGASRHPMPLYISIRNMDLILSPSSVSNRMIEGRANPYMKERKVEELDLLWCFPLLPFQDLLWYFPLPHFRLCSATSLSSHFRICYGTFLSTHFRICSAPPLLQIYSTSQWNNICNDLFKWSDLASRSLKWSWSLIWRL